MATVRQRRADRYERVHEWLWENTRGRLSCWWDGHPLHVRLWSIQHPPIEMWWSPQWTLHLRKRNPVFWLVLIFGKDV